MSGEEEAKDSPPIDVVLSKAPQSACFSRTFNSLAVGAGVGTMYGSLQAVWDPNPIRFGKRGEVLRGGRTDFASLARLLIRPAVWLGVGGAVYTMADCTAAYARQRNDQWNAVIGGMAAGVVVGAVTKRFATMAPASLALGVIMGAIQYAQVSANSYSLEPDKNAADQNEKHAARNRKHLNSKANIEKLKAKYPQFKDM